MRTASDWVVREGLFEEVSLEQRPNCEEAVRNCEDRMSQGDGAAPAESLGGKYLLVKSNQKSVHT